MPKSSPRRAIASSRAHRRLSKALRETLKQTGNKDAAAAVGREIAALAKQQGIEQVAFDRSGFKFHGRVKALADAAREAGLTI